MTTAPATNIDAEIDPSTDPIKVGATLTLRPLISFAGDEVPVRVVEDYASAFLQSVSQLIIRGLPNVSFESNSPMADSSERSLIEVQVPVTLSLEENDPIAVAARNLHELPSDDDDQPLDPKEDERLTNTVQYLIAEKVLRIAHERGYTVSATSELTSYSVRDWR